MKTETYYIIQVAQCEFVMRWGSSGQHYAGTYGKKNASRFTLTEARQICRAELGDMKKRGELPRRFPRIIKVTTEYKTITKN